MARLIKVPARSKDRVIPHCAVLVAALVLLGASFTLFAAEENPFLVTVQKTRFMHLKSPIEGVQVHDTSIVDVAKLDPNHLYFLGKKLGSTNVILLCKSGPCDTIDVEVTHDLDGLKTKLHELFPNEHPEVRSSQGSIVLSGQVSSLQKMDAIVKIAQTFVLSGSRLPTTSQMNIFAPSEPGGSAVAGVQPGSSPGAPQGQATGVINLMQVGGPQQVMLGVTVSEIDRQVARNLSVSFHAIGGSGNISGGAVSGTANLSSGPVNGLNGLLDAVTSVASTTINPYGLFFRFLGSDASFSTFINAAKSNGLAKVLAEPNLTVISGQDASFMSGGSFPMPVPQTGSTGGLTITVQMQPYGVMLKFLPVVLDTNRISLKLNIDVSEISANNSILIPVSSAGGSYTIPSLIARSANTSLELDDGQTIGIAGLISDNVSEAISKFPGLGDIPILGQLFTSQQFQNNETELVIFVTPHLVKPVSPDSIRLPTDKYVEPSDTEFYWMGRTEGRQMPERVKSGQAYTGGLRGHFGQQP